jgi:hypothetical protein
MHLSLDSTTWWITVSNLTPLTRYGYQFLMDNNLKVEDINKLTTHFEIIKMNNHPILYTISIEKK